MTLHPDLVEVLRARDAQEVVLSIAVALHLIVGILGVTVDVLEDGLGALLQRRGGDAGLGLGVVVPRDGLVRTQILDFVDSARSVLLCDSEEDLVVVAELGEHIVHAVAFSVLEGEEHTEERPALMGLEVGHILELVFPRQRDLTTSIIAEGKALLLWVEEATTDIIAVHIAVTVVVTFLDEDITGRPLEGAWRG